MYVVRTACWTLEIPDRILRKHVHAIYCDISRLKNDTFLVKNCDIFLIFAQNIDCGYMLEPPQWGGSNEYSQSMFKSKYKTIMRTPVNPSFTIYKWGVRGSSLHGHVFVMT